MKYLLTILCLYSLVVFQSCDTEESLGSDFEDYFIKYYGQEGSQTGVDIELLGDGSFLILGNSIATNSSSQVILVMADALGNEMWSNTYGGSGNEIAVDVEVNDAGEIFVAANVFTVGSNDSKVLIYKLNNLGSMIDSVILGDDGFINVVNDIIVTNNQDIISVGRTNNTNDNTNDILTYRLTTSLSEVPNWDETIGFIGANDESGQRVIENNDGSLIYFSTSNTPAEGNSSKAGFNFYIFQTNSQGQPSSLEEQFYGNSFNQFMSSANSTFDDGAVMVGSTISDDGSGQLYISRIRNSFLLVFEDQLSTVENTFGKDIIESSFGGLLVAADQAAGTTNDIFLARLNSQGSIIWSKTFGGLDEDNVSTVRELPDGSIILLGTVELESQSKIALIKINSEGEFDN